MMLFVVGIECGHTFDYTTRECCKLSAMTVAVSVLTRVFDIICRTHKLTHVVFWIPRSVPYLTVSLALSICNMDNTALPKYFAINNTVHIHVNANATNISCTEHCYHPIVTTINNPLLSSGMFRMKRLPINHRNFFDFVYELFLIW